MQAFNLKLNANEILRMDLDDLLFILKQKLQNLMLQIPGTWKTNENMKIKSILIEINDSFGFENAENALIIAD